jgi:uncharacterized protein YajQ (UPF0234 family)
MNLTKKQWKSILSAMSFNETDNEVEAILRTLDGEYAMSTESEQVEFLTEVLQNIDDLQEVLQPLKEQITQFTMSKLMKD